MEEGALTESKRFLKYIINERLSTPPDEFVHPCLAGNYSLKPEEVKGEVCDWVLNYLEQSHCPHQLAIFIAVSVANQINVSVNEKLATDPDDPYPTVNASSLHGEVLTSLHELCNHLMAEPLEMSSGNLDKTLPFSSSVFAIKNKRRKMEDRHVVIHDLNNFLNLEKSPAHAYYAVFDGHAGIDAANYAAAHLHEDIARHPDFLKDTVKAIKESYKLTDAHICERSIREGIKGGCTVVSALIRDKQTLFLSWLGDSQSILVKQGKPVILTDPHKPDRPDERKRIEDLGGFVYLVGTWRVNGSLAVARALGDTDFKPHVSSDPDVIVVSLDGTEDFLVLACDGLWDNMKPEEVASALYKNILEQTDEGDVSLTTLAEKLVHQSKLQGSDDNISVIVLLLRDVSVVRANARVYSASTMHMNGKSEHCYGDADYLSRQQPLEINDANVFDALVQNHTVERPKDLHDIASFPSLNTVHDLSGSPSHGLATCLPPEATALSELPTPPIDDMVPTKGFSELECTEQMEQLQSHLQASGFHGTCFGEHNSETLDSLQHDPSSLDKNSLEDPMFDPQDFYATEVSSNTVFPVNELIVKEMSPEKCAMDIASTIITSTIESAMEHVNASINTPPPAPEINGATQSRLNPNAEPFVMKNFSPTSPPIDDNPPMLPVNIQPSSFESNPFSANDVVNCPQESGGFSAHSFGQPDLYEKSSELCSDEDDPIDFATIKRVSPERIKTNCADLEKAIDLSEQPNVEDSCLGKPDPSHPASSDQAIDEALLCLQEDDQVASPSADPITESIERSNSRTPEVLETGSDLLIQHNIEELCLTETDLCPSGPSPSTAAKTELFSLEKEELLISPQAESIVKSTEADSIAADSLGMNVLSVESEDPCLMESGVPEQTSQLLEPSSLDDLTNTVSNTECSTKLFENSQSEKNVTEIHTEDGFAISVIEQNYTTSNISKLELEKEISTSHSQEESINVETSIMSEQLDSVSVDSIDIKQYDVAPSGGACQNDLGISAVHEVESSVDSEDKPATGDTSQEVSNISPSVSNQVIGGDSLLPKEIQDELLKAVENTPSESTEDTHHGDVAVDLQAVPDGVPEAEGVCEDIDSDSEKDGGWSYVKTNEDVTAEKGTPDSKGSAVKAKKTVEKKPGVGLLTKSKKEPPKSLKDVGSRGKISSNLEKARRLPIEKKASETKVGSVTKSSTTTVGSVAKSSTTTVGSVAKSSTTTVKSSTTTSTSRPTKPTLSTMNRVLPQKAASDSTTSTVKSAAPRSATKVPPSVNKIGLAKPSIAATKSTQPKTSTISSSSMRPKPTRPASVTASTQSKDKGPAPKSGTTTTTSVPLKAPSRPTSAPVPSRANLSRPLTKPIAKTTVDGKPQLVKKQTSVTNKLEVKEEKNTVNKQIVKKLPVSSTQTTQKPPLHASTPRSNSISNPIPKPSSQSRITKNAASTRTNPLVQPSKQHVGLKPPRTGLKTDKFAKTKKDSASNNPSELNAKSKTPIIESKEEPKNTTKEKFILETDTKETESELVPNVAQTVEEVSVSLTSTKDEITMQNEVTVDPVNADMIL